MLGRSRDIPLEPVFPAAAMPDKPITRVMSERSVVVEPGTTVARARQIMAGHDVHHLPVVLGGRLVGMLSTADLPHADPEAKVAHLMTARPVSIQASASVQDAATLLGAGMFHSLPVVDAAGTLVGVVTSTDLIRLLSQQLPGAQADPATGHALPAAASETLADPAMLEAVVHAAERQRARGEDPDAVAAALI